MGNPVSLVVKPAAMPSSILKATAKLLGSMILAFTVTAALAQTITGDEIKAQLLRDWERAKTYTLDYLNTMPADKYSFKPMDSIRIFAQQMLHLAHGNIFLAMNGTGQKPIMLDRNLEQTPSAQTVDSVLYFVRASYDFVIEGIEKLDANKLGEKVRRSSGNRDETRYAWILKAFEHQTHHRGQTTIYIRLAGLRPPNEQLF